MYISTCDSRHYQQKAANWSDRIHAARGLIARVYTPLEDLNGWGRNELESALTRLLKEQESRAAENEAVGLEIKQTKQTFHLAKGEAKGQAEEYLMILKRTRRFLRQEVGKLKKDIRILERLIVSFNDARELDQYRKAVRNVTDINIERRIEQEYERLRAAADGIV